MKNLIFSLCLLFGTVSYSQSYQDSVILLNGNVFRGEVVEKGSEYLTLKVPSKKGEEYLNLENYRVFSYTKGETETLLYRYDSLNGNFLTVDQSRNYTLGSYDAKQTYKPRVAFISNILMGYGVSLYDSYLTKSRAANSDVPLTPGFFGQQPSILPLGFMFASTITFALPSLKVKEKYILQKGLKGDKFYYHGFNRIAKQKRAFAALKGSAIGIGLGYLSYAAFRINT